MKCSSMKTIKVAFPLPHPAGNFYDLLLCVGWFVCFSYEPYFSEIKQLVCGMREARV